MALMYRKNHSIAAGALYDVNGGLARHPARFARGSAPCATNQKPGDVLTPNGMKINSVGLSKAADRPRLAVIRLGASRQAVRRFGFTVIDDSVRPATPCHSGRAPARVT
jgi:hypothetical protein